MSRILIVAGEPRAASDLGQMLSAHGYATICADSVAAALRLIDSQPPGLVITAQRLVDGAGLDLVRRAHRCPVIIVSDRGSIRAAVDCMRAGAVDYLVRPVEPEELLLSVERALRDSAVARHAANDSPIPRIERHRLIGHSDAMRLLLDAMRRVAPSGAPVLVRGESGTGKSLVARTLHAMSDRRDGPLIQVNCITAPLERINEEFSRIALQTVGGGEPRTLVLHEIGELPAPAQQRLLELLTDSSFGSSPERSPLRLITTTQRDLFDRTATGQFPEALLRTIARATVVVPPLRERQDDLLALAEFALERIRRDLCREPLTFSSAAVDALRRYSWPGNVRELQNIIERAVILCAGDVIEPDHLAIAGHAASPAPSVDYGPGRAAIPGADDATSLEDYFVRFVLEHQEFMTETELAEKLGISRKSLWERRHRLKIPRTRTRTRGARG